jgi:hypothetical protein
MNHRVFSRTFESETLAELFGNLLLEGSSDIVVYAQEGRQVAVKVTPSFLGGPESFLRAGFQEHPSDAWVGDLVE